MCPKFDGSYQEREARNAIVPRDRWIDNLTSQAAFHALRPDGKSFYNDDNMELYVRCISGHSRYVELDTIEKPCGRTPWKSHHTTCPMHPSLVIKTMKIESTAALEIHRAGQEDRSVQEEDRHIHVPCHLSMELRSRKSCSKASSQDELAPLKKKTPRSHGMHRRYHLR